VSADLTIVLEARAAIPSRCARCVRECSSIPPNSSISRWLTQPHHHRSHGKYRAPSDKKRLPDISRSAPVHTRGKPRTKESDFETRAFLSDLLNVRGWWRCVWPQVCWTCVNWLSGS